MECQPRNDESTKNSENEVPRSSERAGVVKGKSSVRSTAGSLHIPWSTIDCLLSSYILSTKDCWRTSPTVLAFLFSAKELLCFLLSIGFLKDLNPCQ